MTICGWSSVEVEFLEMVEANVKADSHWSDLSGATNARLRW